MISSACSVSARSRASDPSASGEMARALAGVCGPCDAVDSIGAYAAKSSMRIAAAPWEAIPPAWSRYHSKRFVSAHFFFTTFFL